MKKQILLAVLLLQNLTSFSQKNGTNYDETKVGTYTLPDPFLGKLPSTKEWEKQRKTWMNLFGENMYGNTPKNKVKLRFELLETKTDALNNLAIRKRVNIYFTEYPNLLPIELLLYIPKSAKKAVPVFVSLNYFGNQCISTEIDIPITKRWVHDEADKSVKSVINHVANEKSRGIQARRWPLETLMKRGYAVATAYYGDIEPDHPEGWKTGIRSMLGDTLKNNNWGAIGAWAWGMSRMVDYLETDKDIEMKKVIALGHSRLGKASLWAGVQDKRFAMEISNDSGEGGAALTRRNFGENLADIKKTFSFWYCKNYVTFVDKISELPFDQHILLSLIAPRFLYVASASQDLWADPKGEFLSAINAEKVYNLYGKVGLGKTAWPLPNTPTVGKTIGYHLRDGIHDILLYDWEKFMDFADKSFSKIP